LQWLPSFSFGSGSRPGKRQAEIQVKIAAAKRIQQGRSAQKE